MSATPTLRDGYAHRLDAYWRSASQDDWDTDMMIQSDCAKATYVGDRVIDGSVHNVFVMPDGTFRAQLPSPRTFA